MIGTPLPPEIMTTEIWGIYASAIPVVLCVVAANVIAVKRLQAAGTATTAAHWFPTGYAVVLTVSSLVLSHTRIYELYLDQLYAPSAFGIVLPLIVLVVYAVRSQTFRELVGALPGWWLPLPHLTRVSGLLILLLYTHDALPAHVAWPIGYGDIACALLAGPTAWLMWRAASGWRRAALGFAIFGILDFVIALQVTVWTLPNAIRAIHTELDSSVLAMFPVIIAPTLSVPLLYMSLFAIIIKSRQPSA